MSRPMCVFVYACAYAHVYTYVFVYVYPELQRDVNWSPLSEQLHQSEEQKEHRSRCY